MKMLCRAIVERELHVITAKIILKLTGIIQGSNKMLFGRASILALV